MAHEVGQFELPLSIITVADLARLERELVGIDEFMLQASVRRPGEAVRPPRTTRALEEVAQTYHLNLLQSEDRQRLTAFFKEARAKAPVIHISFAADPSAAFLRKLIAWFRSEINPQILLQIGLQPSIAAGCIIRTPNKYFDLSLRRHFYQHSRILLDKISEVAGA